MIPKLLKNLALKNLLQALLFFHRDRHVARTSQAIIIMPTLTKLVLRLITKIFKEVSSRIPRIKHKLWHGVKSTRKIPNIKNSVFEFGANYFR